MNDGSGLQERDHLEVQDPAGATVLSKIHIGLGTDAMPRQDLVRVARKADELGFRGVWLTEALGRDVFGVLTEIALATERLELATGIVNVYGRSPATLAQTASGMSEVAGGRGVHLGIGTSGRALVEDFHGVPFDRPVSRLRDYVRELRSALGGEAPESGTTVVRPRSLPLQTHPLGPVDVFVAALTPASQRVAAEADGWLPIWLDERELTVSPAAGGRVAAYYYTCIDPDRPDSARDIVRRSAAWYIAANGTAYANLFRRRGFIVEVDEIVERWQAGDRRGARAAVPDEIINRTSLAGTPAGVLDRLCGLLESGVTDPVLRFPDDVDADRAVEMLTQLAARA